MFYTALVALALSAVPIFALCIGDPKRRRTLGYKGGMTSGKRRLLVAVACVPGFFCASLGDAAAFFMWLGGCAILGWALAAWFRSDTASRKYR